MRRPLVLIACKSMKNWRVWSRASVLLHRESSHTVCMYVHKSLLEASIHTSPPLFSTLNSLCYKADDRILIRQISSSKEKQLHFCVLSHQLLIVPQQLLRDSAGRQAGCRYSLVGSPITLAERKFFLVNWKYQNLGVWLKSLNWYCLELNAYKTCWATWGYHVYMLFRWAPQMVSHC